VSDSEAFRRPLGGYFRDRFELGPFTAETQRREGNAENSLKSSAFSRRPGASAVNDRLRILFISPYPICPPVHGGGVFMYQTLREMAKLTEVHVLELLDWPAQTEANEELRTFCASAEWLVRPSGRPPEMASTEPRAVREFAIGDLDWLIHRQIYQKKIDVVQLEYTPMAQYRGEYRHIVNALFEHDVYFQSIGRGLGHMIGLADEWKARIEYLRALRYELGMLPAFDQVQVCTPANRDYLLSFRPEIAPRLKPGLRAGIDTSRYVFRPRGRTLRTMLFLGSWRHDPNRVAVDWFMRHVMPMIGGSEPEARLVIVGSDPPPEHTYADHAAHMHLLGFVDDVREPLSEYAVFVCPILSGSGVRVKLLEAFAAGIPVVSTRLGAEGLAREDGEVCLLADDAAGFAERVVKLLENPVEAGLMAERAR